jgi:hypothetical protein
MSNYWYCCTYIFHMPYCLIHTNGLGQCGDGPHNGANVSVCTSWSCGHSRCSGCTTRSENHSWMTLSSTGIQHTTSLYDHSRGHGHVRVSSRFTSVPEYGGTKEYRWTCCGCGGDNSCAYDAGCSYCSNHWRQGCCHVYEVARPKR